MDRMTKSTHLLHVKTTYLVRKLAKLYLKEIVQSHDVPVLIVSDPDARFTLTIWKELQECFGTKLKFNTALHPQMDGQSEQTIQTLENMLRVCKLDFPRSWVEKVTLMKFASNNSYYHSLEISSFQAL